MHTFTNLFNQYFHHPQGLEVGFSVLVFLIAYMESFAILGFIMPGTVLLFGAAGFAIKEDLVPYFLVATGIGGFLADMSSFYLGAKGNAYITRQTHKYEKVLSKIHHFFHTYGALTIILGKLIGTLRPLTSFVAGTSGMDVKKYAFLTAIASTIWSCTYVFFVYNFTKYIRYISHTIVMMGIVAIFIVMASVILQKNIRPSSDPDLSHLKKDEKEDA